MLTTPETESILTEAPIARAHTGSYETEDTAEMGDDRREIRRLAEEIDEIRVRGLRDAIAHQQEIVDRCGKVSTEVAKLVMIQQQRLGENHDQLANAKLLAEIQQRRLTESQDRLARLRQDLAALFSELVEKRSCGGGGHTRASPAFVPH